MPKQAQPEWARYKVGCSPINSDNWRSDCKPLTEIFHVAHIDAAWQILVANRIKSGLVYDKSRLNTERILVTWVSPNDWTGAGGFRYGNVRFAFAWNQLVQDKNYYWVESIVHYHPPACRILVTSNDYSGRLDKYDPTVGDGPWWHDRANKAHYWNGDYCLEIMLEQDLSIDNCIKIDFVKHHPHYCSINLQNCPDKSLSSLEASKLFVARLVSQEMKLAALSPDIVEMVEGQISRRLQRMEIEYQGSVTDKDPAALPLVRAVFDNYSRSNDFSVSQLAGLFRSEEDLLRSCTKALQDTFACDY